jgi:endothelin-converting enzyme/putative endopeptidase
MMRSTLLLLCALLPAAPLIAQTQHGIEVSDLDRKADPCNDFYEFANGTWRAQNPIPASMDRWSRRWAAGETNKEQLKTILEQASVEHNQPKGSSQQLTGDFYGACMDESKINAAGLAPLKPMLGQIEAIHDGAGMQKMIVTLQGLSIQVPFALQSTPDLHKPSMVIADIGAAGLGLPDRDYYLKPEQRFKDAREKYVVHVAKMFGLAGYSDADSAKAANTVMQFETALAKASLDNVAKRDPKQLDHTMTFADLQKLAPHFDWIAYFDSAKIPRDTLNVEEPQFLQEFDLQITGGSLAGWKVYLAWHLLHDNAPYLSQPFVDENFAFYQKDLEGRTELKPRWKQCAEAADQLLGDPLGKEYVARYFPPEAKAHAKEMVNNILLAMTDTVQNVDWMSPETKKRALEKLSTFNVKIGYPDKWKDYSMVDIGRDSLFNNVVNASRFNVADDLAQIGKPIDRSRWGMTPPTSNAYYNPLMNEIVFPAGILQPPAFSLDYVDAVNYGAIGVVIGHEISHGFDDEGSQFDAQGRLSNWWTPEDQKRFQAKTQCVVTQFDSYYIEPGIHHNGKLVLGESIGDLGGAKIAYLAFQKDQKAKPQPTIDGFTPDQQFFIAWGQFRGDETRVETQRKMIQGDPHPVAKYRVIGPLSNFPPFAETFSCKAGSAMVRPPETRCVVW